MPELDESSRRLRALGYYRDPDGRWRHARLGLVAPRPDLLLECDPEALRRFHADTTWPRAEELPEAPVLEPALGRAAREAGLLWQPWLGGYEAQDGTLLFLDDLTRLGPDGLRRGRARQRAWRSAQRARTLAAAISIGLMVIWLLVGWLVGTAGWLLGMALIAGAAFTRRPLPPPKDLWPGIDEARIDAVFDEGKRLLGPGFEELAESLGAASGVQGIVHLYALRLTARADALRAGVSPEALGAVLGALERPPDELDDDDGSD
ncbi:hypothetical protein L6R49_21490 [Myxococcota bacterium]|nr:hypothetical protein [Myxococcota bacterium]